MDAITRRHAACGDDGMEMLAADDPLAILRYLLSRPDVPLHVRAADAGDALVVIGCLHAELARLERGTLKLAKGSGLSWTDVARVRGGSAQAAQQRYQRLENAGDDAPVLAPEAAWLAASAARIGRAARAVARSALPAGVQDETDDLDEVLAEADPRPSELMAVLRPLVKGLTAGGAMWCLSPWARVEVTGLLAAWDRVRDGKAA